MKLNACLTSDAWSNIKNEPIVNYMLISDSSTFFLESVSTGEQSHDAKWIAQDMGRIIDSLAGKMKAQLQKAQLTENLPGLVQPASTRWGSLKACFESLRKSEHVLHRIVSARDFIQATGKQKESQQKIHDIITDGKFVEHLEKAIMILNPADTAIVVFQKLDFLYGDAIGIAYLLDPRFVGEKMTAFERTRVEDLIFDYGSETEQAQQMGKKEEMYLQYTNFVIRANHNKNQKDVSLPDVGKGNQDYPAVLLRNSLGSEKVKKLVYIKTNASQFGNQNMKDLVDTETESESEVERD
ncbi:hypothetical protein BASA62_003976 [Batrachochytrium salamandrivorans]|nr:hypothetical protein BASA62_003976 [Batrachochytrium salamandrivorans]